MERGDIVALYELRSGDCFLYKGRRAIVTDWWNGDRLDDFMRWQYEDGDTGQAHVPDTEVKFLGKGTTTLTIQWPTGDATQLKQAG